MTPYEIADEICGLYEKYGFEHYDLGEAISQLEHAAQAAELAREETGKESHILSAFLHDIGHLCELDNQPELMGGFGIKQHEKYGAEYLLRKGFSDEIAELVKGHVQTKRYLTAKYPNYYNSLSTASKNTLEHQGGPMSQEECASYEATPLFNDHILMRKWDDLAKVPDIAIPPMEVYRRMIIAHLENNLTECNKT